MPRSHTRGFTISAASNIGRRPGLSQPKTTLAPRRATTGHLLREIIPRVGLPLATLAALILIWIAFASRYPPYILPGPDRVVSAFGDSWRAGTIRSDFMTTLQESCLGWAIGVCMALPLGYLVARWRYLDWAVAPYIAGSQAVPVIAIAPLLLLWVSFGMELKVILAAIVSFFPLMTTTVAGLRGVPAELSDVARTFGANWWQRLVHLEAPVAARSMLAGARIAILLAVVGAYVGELVNADHGLGALVYNNIQTVTNVSTATAFAGVLCFVAMTMALYLVLTIFERQVLRWTE